MIPTCTRRLEFDAAHRVTRHGGKCHNLHGHRYRVELTVAGVIPEDGMILDFGLVKQIVGGWIDEHLDHGAILARDDDALIALVREQGWKLYVLDVEPTAENIAILLLGTARTLLTDHGIEVVGVEVWETPNCRATVTR